MTTAMNPLFVIRLVLVMAALATFAVTPRNGALHMSCNCGWVCQATDPECEGSQLKGGGGCNMAIHSEARP